MEDEAARGGETFDPDLIRAIFKLVWSRRGERGGGGGDTGEEVIEIEPAPETSRRNRSATANASALKVSCELLRRLFNVQLLSPKQRALPLLSPHIWSVCCRNFFWTFELRVL
uniref:Uncharacterized protein n=1 Tax=Oryza punctata TaxID=4537 RepID=A0A0E0KRZ3_ORYPU